MPNCHIYPAISCFADIVFMLICLWKQPSWLFRHILPSSAPNTFCFTNSFTRINSKHPLWRTHRIFCIYHQSQKIILNEADRDPERLIPVNRFRKIRFCCLWSHENHRFQHVPQGIHRLLLQLSLTKTLEYMQKAQQKQIALYILDNNYPSFLLWLYPLLNAQNNFSFAVAQANNLRNYFFPNVYLSNILNNEIIQKCATRILPLPGKYIWSRDTWNF